MRLKGRKAETGVIWISGDLGRGWFQRTNADVLGFYLFDSRRRKSERCFIIWFKNHTAGQFIIKISIFFYNY